MIIRIRSIVILALISLLIVPNAVYASIDWMEGDIIRADNIMPDPGFESSTGTQFGNGTVDTDTFADTHGNTLMATSYMQIRDALGGKLMLAVQAGESMTLSFDYYTEVENTYMRCELRSIAASNEITEAAQNEYWTGFQFSKSNYIPTGEWHHFEATFDTQALKDYYTAQGIPLSVSGAKQFEYANFFLQGINSSEFYIDNVSIVAGEDTIVPLQTPILTYDSENFVLDPSVLDQNGESGSVYKVTKNITNEGLTPKAFTLSNYRFNDGTYKLSFWFKEDANNQVKITRMWRPYAAASFYPDNEILSEGSSGDRLYYRLNDITEPAKDVWHYVSLDFNVSESANSALLTQGTPITVYWNTRATEKNFKWDNATMAGDYTVYISGVDIFKYPDPASKTVSIETSITTMIGENTIITAEGYFDPASTAELTVNENTYIGTISELTTTNEYSTASYSFDTSALRDKSYSGTFSIEDIWGRTDEQIITLDVVGPQLKEFTLKNASWSGNIVTIPETVVTGGSGDAYVRYLDNEATDNKFIKPIKDLYAEGNPVVKLGFSVSGDGETEYTGSGAQVVLRTSSSNEFSIDIPLEDLNDGEIHYYETTCDLGAIDRYYEYKSGETYLPIDRTNVTWNLFFRERIKEDGKSIIYDNISLQYLQEDLSGEHLWAKLKITNNVSDPYQLSGDLITAAYDVLEMSSVMPKPFNFSNSTTTNGTVLNNALAEGESKIISTVIEDYNNSYTYKAFWWDSLTDMTPMVDAVVK